VLYIIRKGVVYGAADSFLPGLKHEAIRAGCGSIVGRFNGAMKMCRAQSSSSRVPAETPSLHSDTHALPEFPVFPTLTRDELARWLYNRRFSPVIRRSGDPASRRSLGKSAAELMPLSRHDSRSRLNTRVSRLNSPLFPFRRYSICRTTCGNVRGRVSDP